MQKAQVKPFFDANSETWSYVVYDQEHGHAAIIDPVMGFDYASGNTNTVLADEMIAFLQQKHLTLEWILETHAHADHLSAATYLRNVLGGKIGISEKIQQVQKVFGDIFHLEKNFFRDGSQFDYLFKDGESFFIGALKAKALATPGHTPADISWIIADSVFVGDTVFMPDIGTARCDFPGGDAKLMYQSIQRLLVASQGLRMFVCHDYPAGKREYRCETNADEQNRDNIHINQHISEEQFVEMRSARDKTLGLPRLMIPSVQVNIRAGDMPAAEENGVVYLKVPINFLA